MGQGPDRGDGFERKSRSALNVCRSCCGQHMAVRWKIVSGADEQFVVGREEGAEQRQSQPGTGARTCICSSCIKVPGRLQG